MNNKHLRTRPNNIRFVLRICIAVLCICAAITTFSTVKMQSKSSDTVRQYADVFVSKLSAELSNNNAHLENTAFTSANRNMYYVGGMEWVDQVRILIQNYNLLNSLSSNHYNYFAYNTDLNKYLEITAVSMPFSEYVHIRSGIKTLAQGPVESGCYTLHEMPGGQRVILTMWAYNEFICGCWITEDAFLSGLDHLGEKNIAQFSLIESEITTVSQVADNYTYELSGVDANFCVRMQVEPDPDMSRILLYQILQLILLMIGMMVLMVSVSAVRENLLVPMQNLQEILDKYKMKTTSYDAVSPKFSNTLDDTYRVLSQLGEQLETLSVRLYEAELEKRQLNINFRNLQIRPHFLVNNLATIHDMAQLGEIDKIMNLTVVLSNYYRYVLRDCMEVVPLWQELRHMDNIIKVHREWNGNSIRLDYHVEDGVKNIKIPVLLVSTFLENSIKHAVNSKGGLNIGVSAQRKGAFLYVCIQDDGAGFPNEILEYLNREHMVPETGGRHIGINNAIQRIRLIYGDAARIILSNCSGGAQVEIWIPLGGEQK